MKEPGRSRDPADEAGTAPSDRTTLVAVLDAYDRAGYGAQFTITEEGTIRCATCRHEMAPATMRIDSIRRLEGASDPDDMLAVLALSCAHCGARGTAIAHYGPESSPGETTVLLALEDHRRASDISDGIAPGEGDD